MTGASDGRNNFGFLKINGAGAGAPPTELPDGEDGLGIGIGLGGIAGSELASSGGGGGVGVGATGATMCGFTHVCMCVTGQNLTVWHSGGSAEARYLQQALPGPHQLSQNPGFWPQW
mmetsp:Transcript_100973/g.292079  ORF Transcript_100973/g.292079 Transcript_100973/m.292079 type:complete len:117 (+) Transcript_100973:901-1251(+)